MPELRRERRRVLLVEDDPGDALLVTEALATTARARFIVENAATLADALSHLQAAPPDVVLLDLMLPDACGTECVTRVREVAPSVPVVVLTGRGDESLGFDAMEIGAQDYLIKGETSNEWLAHALLYAIERAESSVALAISEAKFRTLYDDNPSAYFTVNGEGRIRSINRAGAALMGYEPAELCGVPVTAIHVRGDRDAVAAYYEACRRSPGRLFKHEFVLMHQDGSQIPVRELARAVKGVRGGLPVLVVCEDLRKIRQLSEDMAYAQTHDELTGAVTRAELTRRLARACQRASEEQVQHAFCHINLDRFKLVNDTSGQVAGDKLLRAVATLIGKHVRKGDTLARLGADVFVVLLERCPLGKARALADLLRAEIEQLHLVHEGRRISTQASIGLVSIGVHGADVEAVMAAADSACCAAKEGGRNRVQVYDERDHRVARRREEIHWVRRIEDALEQGRFRLFAQSVVPLRHTGSGVHYELLLRLANSDGTTTPPGIFIPAAEHFGLAPQVDAWVVNTYLAWLATHPACQSDLAMCSINLSGASICDEPFQEFVVQAVSATGVPAAKICFEITETAAVADVGRARRFIDAVRSCGCRFALDDFGSGMSSFGYLKSLPVDFLKIDGMFVKEIAVDPINLEMVWAINKIGHVMGKQTIAEYAESEAIIAKLGEIGVDFAQGFAVARPVPLESFAKLPRDLDAMAAGKYLAAAQGAPT